ncbi:MAG: hypothetical protein NZX11_09585, partial [Thermus sp.]|nr:hypothetical protein [Thermus sp.]
FDAGGRDTLRFGGAACATTGDGSFLGWALPEAQVGERIPERTAWDLLANTLKGFHNAYGRFPRHVLLLRDGRIPQGEFRLALEGLRQEEISYDLISVRKTGSGRIYPVRGRLGDGVFLPLEGWVSCSSPCTGKARVRRGPSRRYGKQGKPPWRRWRGKSTT